MKNKITGQYYVASFDAIPAADFVIKLSVRQAENRSDCNPGW